MEVLWKRRTLAALLLVAWCSQALYLFYLPPSTTIDSTAQVFRNIANENEEILAWMREHGLTNIDVATVEEDVKLELWTNWYLQFVLILLGIGSGIMTFLSIRFWKSVVILVGLVYLGVWYASNTSESMSLLRAYELRWQIATTFQTISSFIHRSIVLPLFYIGVITVLGVQYIQAKKRSGSIS